MARASLILVVLALAASRASAETRSILIRVTVNGDKAEVTVHSEEKKDRREKVTAAEGWGSVINVYVAADKGVKDADLKKVLDAARGNHWCKLHPVGEVPRRIRESFAGQAISTADDPEPPARDQAKRLKQIAASMDDLARRLKDDSLGEQTRTLQDKVLSQLGDALKREKAVKRERQRLQVAPGIEQARAMQDLLTKKAQRLEKLGGKDRERTAQLLELSDLQSRTAQMLRDLAAKCEPAR